MALAESQVADPPHEAGRASPREACHAVTGLSGFEGHLCSTPISNHATCMTTSTCGAMTSSRCISAAVSVLQLLYCCKRQLLCIRYLNACNSCKRQLLCISVGFSSASLMLSNSAASIVCHQSIVRMHVSSVLL